MGIQVVTRDPDPKKWGEVELPETNACPCAADRIPGRLPLGIHPKRHAVLSTRRGAAYAALALILIVACAVRFHNLGFGLPSLYDPDEPIFMVMALKLLKEHTLNPGWFGHPGSTTIYLLALIDVAVFGAGILTGRFSGVNDFAAAAYADPSLLFMPARFAMALFGVGCVWLTYCLGRKLFGTATGLIAAAFLAINSLHILWSQVIRTDVMASLFMLASLIFSVGVAKRGSLRDYLLSGIFIGLAIATKWPSAIVAVALVGAFLARIRARPDLWRQELGRVAGALGCGLVALFLASPFIFLDWRTVLSNVTGEMSPRHLGQTGGGFLHNLRWYMLGQLASSMGFIGLALAIGGAVVAWLRTRVARWTLVPATVGFLALICVQSMVWSRWLVPALPLFCLFAAVAIVGIGRWFSGVLHSPHRALITAAIAVAAAVPSLASARGKIAERAVDTRALAANWAAANIKPNTNVLIEHLELGLRNRPWHFLFPIGEAGCVDGLRILAKGMKYEDLQKLRKGGPIVDLGNVDPAKLDSCNADVAILTYYDLYRSEAPQFPRELENYQRLLAGGRTIAMFVPSRGRVGGPVVRIVALPQLPARSRNRNDHG